METGWVEIACVVPEDLAEEFADFLLEATGNGVSIENRKVDTFNVDDISREAIKNVKAYLESDKDVAGLLQEIGRYLAEKSNECQGFTPAAPEVTALKEEDWANSWKVNFKPTRIGNRLVIKPSWEDYAATADDVILELAPGMAFGTGTHSTTRLCLEAVEQYCSADMQAKELQVLDVGCGSGVLGIAAALLCAAKVVAIDIDPLAVTVTLENAAANGVSSLMAVSTTPLEEIDGSFVIVVANILAEALVALAAALAARVAAGGVLILSGILTEREAFVIAGFASLPLELLEVTHHDEWCCIVYGKRAA
ncbi:MAG: 50S ribosomal protein L11 methyltransferase [Geobacter sp.]|nr:50S ribosomal protein L11 methyltransferase [Geobacter sp.]